MRRIERPGGPFDDTYLVANYAEARALIDQVTEIETRANTADDKVGVFELSGFIFAIGLASTAWASLMDDKRRIRLIFLSIALVCLIAGTIVVSRSLIA